MNRKNIEAIQNATVKALAAQIEHTLTIAKIRGWTFPNNYDVGLTVIAATALTTKVKGRMDEITAEGTLSTANLAEGIAKLADDLISEWLVLHAEKPARKRRAAP